MSTEASQEPISGAEEFSIDPVVVYKTLKFQQSLLFAIVAGSIGALVGGALWAILSITVNIEMGILALAIGIIVGALVRYLGAGFASYFGIIGAFFSVLGYIFGKIIYQLHTISIEESITFLEVIPLLTTETCLLLIRNCFEFFDLLYMGVAAVLTYSISRRAVDDVMIQNAANGELVQAPYAKWRFPALLFFLLLTSSGIYILLTQTTTNKTAYYDTGIRKSTGVLVYGKKHGPWSYFYQTGKVQYMGEFVHGEMEGEWKFFSEDGALMKVDNYKNGQLNGVSKEFYHSGNIRLKTEYNDGLREGAFEMFHHNTQRQQRGVMKKGRAEGSWETYYENGQISSQGNFLRNEPRGSWTYWTETGRKSQESFYEDDGALKLNNTWDENGKPVIVNGKGTFQILSDNNKILESGSVENGMRIGMWEKRITTGARLETGEYRDGKYYLINAWSPKGEPLVVGGEGVYESYYLESSSHLDSGAVSNGLRSGKWVTYFENSSIPMRITTYVDGSETGIQTNYYSNGMVSHEGNVQNGKREGTWTWHASNRAIESVVKYVNGYKEGIQEFYDTSNGKLIRIEKYAHDELIDRRRIQ
jgi:antitoxin component YwqK of YwqJK toxin-antitoxin module